MKTRSSAQIRSHAQKYIIKLCKKFNVSDKNNFKHFKVIQKEVEKTNNELLKNIGDSPIDKISYAEMEKLEGIILGIFKSQELNEIKLRENDATNANIIIKPKVFQTVKIKKKNKKPIEKILVNKVIKTFKEQNPNSNFPNKGISNGSKSTNFNNFDNNGGIPHFLNLQHLNGPNMENFDQFNSNFLFQNGQLGNNFHQQMPGFNQHYGKSMNYGLPNQNPNFLYNNPNMHGSLGFNNNFGQFPMNIPIDNPNMNNQSNDFLLINELVNMINMKSSNEQQMNNGYGGEVYENNGQFGQFGGEMGLMGNNQMWHSNNSHNMNPGMNQTGNYHHPVYGQPYGHHGQGLQNSNKSLPNFQGCMSNNSNNPSFPSAKTNFSSDNNIGNALNHSQNNINNNNKFKKEDPRDINSQNFFNNYNFNNNFMFNGPGAAIGGEDLTHMLMYLSQNNHNPSNISQMFPNLGFGHPNSAKLNNNFNSSNLNTINQDNYNVK